MDNSIVNQLPEEAQNAFRQNIDSKSLIQRNGRLFTVLTSIFFILLIGLLGLIITLLVKMQDKNFYRGYFEDVVTWLIPSLLGVLLVLYGVYYFRYTRLELYASDKIVTDIERKATEPMTNESLKANLTNLVAVKTGTRDRQQINNIYKNLSAQFDPEFYRTPEEQNKYVDARRSGQSYEPPEYLAKRGEYGET